MMDKQMRKLFSLAKREIKEAKKIAIFSHINPDLDCLGSTYALSEALKNMGKEVDMFNKNNFTFEQSLLLDETKTRKDMPNPEEYDLFIALDTATVKRLGDYGELFTNFPNTIRIDHHRNSEDYAMINILDSQASATCQILYQFISFLGVKIDSIIATYLYAGLSSDTHSFMNGITSLKSLQTAVCLYEKGADVAKINECEYYNTPRSTVEIKKIFLQKMQIIDDCVAISYISLDDLQKAGATKSDCDSFSVEMLSIAGIKMSCHITQKEKNKFSLSLRSKNGYDVNLIATIFGGGGHTCAAGAEFEAKNSEVLIDMLTKEIKLYLEKREKQNA